MFPQIHVATGRDTTPFLHVIDKIKKRKSEASIGVSCKVSDITVKDDEKFFRKLSATLGKKNRVLLKQGWDCISK